MQTKFQLEKECSTCNGDGGWRAGDSKWRDCPDCDCKGYLLTEDGKEMLAFMSKHLHVSVAI